MAATYAEGFLADLRRAQMLMLKARCRLPDLPVKAAILLGVGSGDHAIEFTCKLGEGAGWSAARFFRREPGEERKGEIHNVLFAGLIGWSPASIPRMLRRTRNILERRNHIGSLKLVETDRTKHARGPESIPAKWFPA